MKLFLDDTRVPADVGYINEEWTIVRDYETFMLIVDNLQPQEISFDHDLQDYDTFGKEWTGLDCAKSLVEADSRWTHTVGKDFKFHVHSMNPIGKKNIQCYLDNYIKFKRDK